jgi:hypothetical protein
MERIHALDGTVDIIDAIKAVKLRLCNTADPRTQLELMETLDMLHNSLLYELERFRKSA